jgi:hypothetical protein
VSPRKSSTSSGRPARPRPRYLGLEVAGEHLPPLSPRWWEATLRRRAIPPGVEIPFRVVRADGVRALVEVAHHAVPTARAQWTGPIDRTARLTTVRTWGTLVDGKAWMYGRAARPRPTAPT